MDKLLPAQWPLVFQLSSTSTEETEDNKYHIHTPACEQLTAGAHTQSPLLLVTDIPAPIPDAPMPPQTPDPALSSRCQQMWRCCLLSLWTQSCFPASGCTKLIPAKTRFICFSSSSNKTLMAQFWARLRLSERWRQPWKSQSSAGMLFQVHITYRVFTSENALTLYKILLFALQMFTQRKLFLTVHIYIQVKDTEVASQGNKIKQRASYGTSFPKF